LIDYFDNPNEEKKKQASNGGGEYHSKDVSESCVKNSIGVIQDRHKPVFRSQSTESSGKEPEVDFDLVSL